MHHLTHIPGGEIYFFFLLYYPLFFYKRSCKTCPMIIRDSEKWMQNISVLENAKAEQSLEKLFFQKLPEGSSGYVSFPNHGKTAYIHLGLAHTMEVAPVSQTCMCFSYQNTFEGSYAKSLWKHLLSPLSGQHITVHAAPASKQRPAVCIHVLRKKAKGGAHHLKMRTSKTALSPSLLHRQ